MIFWDCDIGFANGGFSQHPYVSITVYEDRSVSERKDPAKVSHPHFLFFVLRAGIIYHSTKKVTVLVFAFCFESENLLFYLSL